MADGERLGASFSIDVTDLKAGLSTANKLIRESQSEFKAAAAGMGDWTKSQAGLEAKIKSLNNITAVQTEKVNALQSEYDRLIADGLDPTSNAAVELRTKINNEKAALAANEAEIKKQQDALEAMKDSSEQTASAADKLRKKVSEQESELDDLNEAYLNATLEQGKYSKAAKEIKERIDDLNDELEQNKKRLGETGDAAKESGDGFTIAKGAVADFISDGLQKLIGACGDAIKSVLGLAESTRDSRTAFAKLEQSFDTAGFSAETAEKTMADLYGVLGDADKANEAAMLISKMSNNQADLEKNTRILTGVYAEYGDSIPTEGLAEAMSATAAMGNVQGVLADALEWQGINLDQYNEKLEGMSSEEERAAFIQKTLTDLYGESADSYRENNAALIEANDAQLDYTETLNKFGEKIEPITTKVREGFNKILDKVLELVDGVDLDAFAEQIESAFDGFINDVLPKIENGFQWIIDNKDILIAGLAGIAAGFAAFKVASLIQGVVSAVKAFQLANEGATVAQALLNSTMLANPMTWVAVGIAALVAGIILLIKNWDKVKEAAVKSWEKIKEIWGVAAEWFSTSVIEPVKNFFSGIGEAISGFFSAAWDGVVAVWSAVAEWFTVNIIEPIKVVFAPLVQFFTEVFNIIRELAEGCWILIQAVWSLVSAWFNENVIQPLLEFFLPIWDAISGAATAAWSAIQGVWSAVSGWFNSKVIQPVKNVFTSLWGSLKNGASSAWSGIKSVFSSVASFFQNTFQKAWTAVKNVFSVGGKIFDGIKDGIVNAFKAIVNGIIGGINKVVAVPFNAINRALDTIRGISIAGIQPFAGLLSRITVPSIPMLAKGGVVDKATTFVAGEAGKEAVIPLERNTEWLDMVADRIMSKQQQSVVVNQTNNYSQAHSRYEIYKSKQQTAAAVRLALQGV